MLVTGSFFRWSSIFLRFFGIFFKWHIMIMWYNFLKRALYPKSGGITARSLVLIEATLSLNQRKPDAMVGTFIEGTSSFPFLFWVTSNHGFQISWLLLQIKHEVKVTASRMNIWKRYCRNFKNWELSYKVFQIDRNIPHFVHYNIHEKYPPHNKSVISIVRVHTFAPTPADKWRTENASNEVNASLV